MDITKASGETEPFDEAKLRESLERAGAPSDLVEKTVQKMLKEVEKRPHTDHLFEEVRAELASDDPVLAMKYGLKRSLLKMGPSGHPFEYYFAQILEAHGYETMVGSIVDGHCVPHEIDVVATKGKDRLMIESKFHTKRGIRSRLKDVLYVHSRYLDVKDKEFNQACFLNGPTAAEELKSSKTYNNAHHDRGYEHSAGKAERGFTEGILVTNTKVSYDGKLFGRCSGLSIISWRYPEGRSLEHLIESKRLYPVSVFSHLTTEALQQLFQNRIYSVQDLVSAPPNELAQLVRLRRKEVTRMQEHAERLLQG